MTAAATAIREAALPLSDSGETYDALIELIGDARVVLLGEASHGTHEFYRERARITQRLLNEKQFNAVVIEADWPDANRVHRYVIGESADSSAEQALTGFKRFPQWMWRNKVIVDFVQWLREQNDTRGERAQKAGIYGMDLYSLHASIDAVLAYLTRIDPDAAARARARYSCFDHFSEDPQTYGYATTVGRLEPCEEEALEQLLEMKRKADEFLSRDGQVAADDYFFAEQNARLVKNAEEYYRSIFRGRTSSWNLRDQHMSETIEALFAHLGSRGVTKLVIWAHNSHLGDARATEMGKRGELNVGQLVRERFHDQAVLVGFSTYTGTVTAASDWGAPCERKRVRRALAGTFEAIFHDAGIERFMLNLKKSPRELETPRLERAIGVIYRPESERLSHYFQAQLPGQFDALLHFDTTQAVEPLERTAVWERGELPETFPFSV